MGYLILAIIISQVFKNVITFCLIGNLSLLFWFSLSLALCYVWSVDGPTCRRRISVLGRNASVREDKAARRRSSLSPPFFSVALLRRRPFFSPHPSDQTLTPSLSAVNQA